MKSTLAKHKSIQFWKSSPSIEDLINVLDFIPNAAIIYDIKKQQILNSNPKFLRMTTYTRLELKQLSFIQLISTSNQEQEIFSEINYTKPIEVDIITRNNQMIPSSIVLSPLDEKHRWFLISIETNTQKKLYQNATQRSSLLLSTIKQFVEQKAFLNKSVSIDIFLESCIHFSQTEIISLYELNKESDKKYHLKKFNSPLNSNFFPTDITLKDILPYKDTLYWQIGKRSTVEIHHFARKHQLSDLISIPIKVNDVLFGILILADSKLAMEEFNISLLSSFVDLLSLHYPIWELLKSKSLDYEEKNLAVHIHQKIFENVQDGIILLSPTLNIIEMNPSAENILGYTTYETCGQPIENILIGTGNLHPSLQLAIEGVETPNLGNISLHRRDGQAFSAIIQIHPVMDQKLTLGVIILIRDLSKHHEIKIRTQQLEQRALLGELTAIFAHEIRNPINNMSLAIQMMEMELGKDDPNQDYIERLKQNRDRLTHLMDTVLSFSRSSTYNMLDMDIIPVIERVLLRWQTHMVREKVQYHFQKIISSAIINGHAQALEQVFNNLISNSIRAMHDTQAGTLHIKIEKLSRDIVQITVSDNGPGIPKENLEHIFQPFFTTDQHSGTGLGLAITQRIVIAHKGKIQVKSFPSGGSVFIIHLPTVHS